MFHGNLVLVSRRASWAVGPIDGSFSHAQADFDYALRARRVGLSNILASGTFGTCVRDASPAPWLDLDAPAATRLRILFGRKGLPPRSAARYLQRHGGPFWPVFWVAPYVKMIASLLRSLRVGKTQS
jgi:GT2 family glycosyltransferase